MINLASALKISGWTYDIELRWLAEQAAKAKWIVEIGCWKGRSTRAMLDSTDGVVYAVDTWLGTKEDGHLAELEGKSPDWLYNEFRRNIGVRRCRPLRMTSLAAAKKFIQGPRFDFCFIDGAHDYQSVYDDISAWRPLMAPGGTFAGHDYDAGRPGVVKAVRELVPDVKQGPGSIWFTTISTDNETINSNR